jgi:hypothetical protein
MAVGGQQGGDFGFWKIEAEGFQGDFEFMVVDLRVLV